MLGHVTSQRTARRADRAAARLARLGRPVKKMIGGVEGWKDEGFRLATADGTR
jgi:hypothetical protein